MHPEPPPATDASVPTAPPPPAVRRVVVLGSTGSIGVNTLAVIEHLTRTGTQPFEVVGLAAGHNVKLLAEQAGRFGNPSVAIAADHLNDAQRDSLKRSTHLFVGPTSACELIEAVEADVVVSAVVGAAGLPATVAAIRRGCTVALANKETLVAAGHWVMPMVAACGATLIPIDSEHSAIFQCLGRGSGNRHQGSGPDARASSNSEPDPRSLIPDPSVKRVVLTASGGPFRDWSLEKMRDATPEQALNHPTWDMGPKITIDSATMMNKALEIIEAHHLFGLPPEKIDVLIHPQSVVHSFVEFADHSVLAQLGPPDMRTPIQIALTHPRRVPGCSDQLDWGKLRRLDFEPPDAERFPALRLAYDCIRAGTSGGASGGGTAGAVLNAANEAAVQAFLERRIGFGRIVELVAEAMAAIPAGPIESLDDVFRADAQARTWVRAAIGSESLKT